jgi:hypothetical protein
MAVPKTKEERRGYEHESKTVLTEMVTIAGYRDSVYAPQCGRYAFQRIILIAGCFLGYLMKPFQVHSVAYSKSMAMYK